MPTLDDKLPHSPSPYTTSENLYDVFIPLEERADPNDPNAGRIVESDFTPAALRATKRTPFYKNSLPWVLAGYAIAPIEVGGKIPLCAWGHWSKGSATTYESYDHDTLLALASRFPRANGALILDSHRDHDLVAVDIDFSSDAHEAAVLDMVDGNAIMARTPREGGGCHIIARVPHGQEIRPCHGEVAVGPEDWEWTLNRLGEGSWRTKIDIKSAASYTITPGSIHRSGGKYQGAFKDILKAGTIGTQTWDISTAKGLYKPAGVPDGYVPPVRVRSAAMALSGSLSPAGYTRVTTDFSTPEWKWIHSMGVSEGSYSHCACPLHGHSDPRNRKGTVRRTSGGSYIFLCHDARESISEGWEVSGVAEVSPALTPDPTAFESETTPQEMDHGKALLRRIVFDSAVGEDQQWFMCGKVATSLLHRAGAPTLAARQRVCGGWRCFVCGARKKTASHIAVKEALEEIFATKEKFAWDDIRTLSVSPWKFAIIAEESIPTSQKLTNQAFRLGGVWVNIQTTKTCSYTIFMWDTEKKIPRGSIGYASWSQVACEIDQIFGEMDLGSIGDAYDDDGVRAKIQPIQGSKSLSKRITHFRDEMVGAKALPGDSEGRSQRQVEDDLTIEYTQFALDNGEVETEAEAKKAAKPIVKRIMADRRAGVDILIKDSSLSTRVLSKKLTEEVGEKVSIGEQLDDEKLQAVGHFIGLTVHTTAPIATIKEKIALNPAAYGDIRAALAAKRAEKVSEALISQNDDGDYLSF
tara:strand:+ start:1146 stop:3401 length:2256 start_codon:yes stop_codon:yes gene_type:complete